MALMKIKFIRKLEISNNAQINTTNLLLERGQKSKVYRFFFKVVQSNYFIFSILAFIIINTILLALDSYP
jgi:hypothetical protein